MTGMQVKVLSYIIFSLITALQLPLARCRLYEMSVLKAENITRNALIVLAYANTTYSKTEHSDFGTLLYHR